MDPVGSGYAYITVLEEFAVFGAGVARTPRGVGTVILLLYGSSNRFFNSKFTGHALTPRGVRAFENSSALTPRGVSATPQVNRPTVVLLSWAKQKSVTKSFALRAMGIAEIDSPTSN